ncbi:MAG: hypothetical protein ACRDRX_24075 [Pseudonocardiaceae bacterium]
MDNTLRRELIPAPTHRLPRKTPLPEQGNQPQTIKIELRGKLGLGSPGGMAIVGSEAEIVREIFAQYLDGDS